jgi:signal transduction histidine kinase
MTDDPQGNPRLTDDSAELRQQSLALASVTAELKRKNRALTAISRVSQVLMESSEQDERVLLQEAVEALTADGQFPLAWVGLKGPDPERLVDAVAIAGRGSEYARRIRVTWKEEPAGCSPCGKALREGCTIVSHDFVSAPDSAMWHEIAHRFGLRSIVSIPLAINGEFCAVLNVYAEAVGAFNADEVSLLSELARSLALGISGIRSRNQAAAERLQRELLEAQLQQSQKLEAIGTLAGGIAHDFNNLLMIIMAQTELLSRDLSGDARKRAKTVMDSATRAAELTSQLLAFSRKQPTRPVVTSINRIVEEMSEMTKRLLPENIDIRLSLCENPWPVRIDCNQFEQVIMNLVVNARDAMPEGGTLTLESANCDLGGEYLEKHPIVRSGRYVVLAVSDDGVGMSPEVQSRLFEPFFTTKELGKGTGLGLAMVYGIVKKANGFIWVYSEIGKGTSFKIYLPVANPEEAEQQTRPPSRAVTSARKATVLVVEDDEGLRGVIGEFLESSGHEAICAGSLQDAGRIASEKKDKIDILLTDIVLAGGNGKQFAQSLEARGLRYQVIYMSGYAPSAVVHHGVLEPGIRFLQKPFTRAMLQEKIAEALS